MPLRAFRLELTAPLHVGDAGIGFEEALSYVPSDTLFSALVITWLQMGETQRVDALADHFADTPPLQISSAFPCADDVFFLPKPQLPLLPEGMGKEYKRVAWVSASIFQRFLSGLSTADLKALWEETRAASQDQGEYRVQGGDVWTTSKERQQLARHLGTPRGQDLTLWSREQTPHVTVDRLSDASNIYHVGQVRFTAGSGLWLLARGETEWLDLVAGALTLLSDAGIGGRRSRGNGTFRLHSLPVQELDLSFVDGNAGAAGQGSVGEYEVLLSRLAPKPDQMARLRAPGSSYSLVTVGGWSSSSGGPALVRQRVNLLAEGSIVRRGDGPAGHLVDVKPQNAPPVPHPIYRYGVGLGLPIRLHEEMLHDERIEEDLR